MSDTDDIPEADRVPGTPHPRQAGTLIGHAQAVSDFTDAAREGRLHHAWMVTGPRGIGKATLVWQLARWLLTGAKDSHVDLDPDSPAMRRVSSLAEPRLQLIRRPWDAKTSRHRAEITVDETRKLLNFFHLSASDGGWRVAIIDAADDMNRSAANALLKVLEEPPANTVIFLISHQPARLLPTIRSRCRVLRLNTLAPEEMGQILTRLDIDEDSEKLAALADGSAGEAARLAGQDGLARYQEIVDLFGTLPRFDRQLAGRLAEKAGARAGGDNGDPFDLTVTLLERFLTRLARAGLQGPPVPQAADGEGALMARLSPHDHAARDWAEAQALLIPRARRGRAVNLDPAALVLDMLIALAGRTAAQGAAQNA